MKGRCVYLNPLFCCLVLVLVACKSPRHATSTPVPPPPIPSVTSLPSTPTPLPPTPKPSSTALTSPTPSPTVRPPSDRNPGFLQVQPDDWVSGPVTATVTIVVYSDFQCPACAPLAGWLNQLGEAYHEQVRVVFRHFPLLGNHDKAWMAAQACEAAGQQGAFWPMHDLLFKGYQAWIGGDTDDTRRVLTGYARRLRLDMNQFDLDDPALQDAVLDDYEQALAHNLPGVPALFVNGKPFEAPLSYFWLDAVVRLELLESDQFSSPPPIVIDLDKRYTAVIETDKGEVDVELDARRAPITVNNFVYLAQRGWYDGVTFFRMLPGYIVQTGDPTDTGLGGPGYELPPEIGLPHTAGALAMARHPDEVNPEKLSNGSQFFITLAPLPELDGDYTVFGYVTQGLDVLQALQPRDPDARPDAPPGDPILTIEIHERPGPGDIR